MAFQEDLPRGRLNEDYEKIWRNKQIRIRAEAQRARGVYFISSAISPSRMKNLVYEGMGGLL